MDVPLVLLSADGNLQFVLPIEPLEGKRVGAYMQFQIRPPFLFKQVADDVEGRLRCEVIADQAAIVESKPLMQMESS